MRTHTVQEVVANENVEIRVDMRINTGVKIQANRPDLLVHGKKRSEIIPIEVNIIGQDRLHIVETEKAQKNDVMANESGQEMQCETKTMSYMLAWGRAVISTTENIQSRSVLPIPSRLTARQSCSRERWRAFPLACIAETSRA
ncbi:hypothetical protein PAPHI01_2523 [Pancytospora philotis]|nr:hypothetical protein PAPHI01_2523 [Pancytospora philotis]